MSWGGNTLARSLALVAVGTGLAFTHWGFQDLTTEIPEPEPEETTPAATDGGEPVPAQDEGAAADPETGEQASETAQDPSPAAFDPNTLGRDIGTADAYELWLLGTVTFLDARLEDDFAAGHIPFAFNVPPDNLGRIADIMEATAIGPSDRVVVYCEGGTCDASHLVGRRLVDLGFTRIHIDLDGFPSWQAAGYEVEEGADMLGDLP